MKKLLTVFLILCLVLPASAVVFADAQAATDDMLALASLGVFDDAALADASANVTRGNFAKIIVNFANAPQVSSVPSYKDIVEMRLFMRRLPLRWASWTTASQATSELKRK